MFRISKCVSAARGLSFCRRGGGPRFSTRSLSGERRGQDTQRSCWVEGPRHFIQAAERGFRSRPVVHCPKLLRALSPR